MRDVYVTNHAQEQAINRYDFIKSKGHAIEWVEHEMQDATYFGNILGKDGRRGRMYVNNGRVFMVDKDSPRVCTTYEPNQAQAVVEQVNKFVETLVKKENKLYNLEMQELQIKVKQAKVDYAMADLELAKATKKAEKVALEQAKAEALEVMKQAEAEIEDREREHATVLKGCASFYH